MNLIRQKTLGFFICLSVFSAITTRGIILTKLKLTRSKEKEKKDLGYSRIVTFMSTPSIPKHIAFNSFSRIYSYLRLVLSYGLLSSVFPTRTVCAFLFSTTCATCHFYIIFHELITLILFR